MPVSRSLFPCCRCLGFSTARHMQYVHVNVHVVGNTSSCVGVRVGVSLLRMLATVRLFSCSAWRKQKEETKILPSLRT